MTKINLYDYGKNREEKVNVITHAPGIALGLFFVFVLLFKEYDSKSISHILSYLIYGISFITVFTASSFYHSAKDAQNKEILKKIDHASIFFFMGGCYTPFVVINMVSDYKFYFLGLVWLIVVVGVIYKFMSKYKNQIISVIFYLSFGFMCLLAKAQFLDLMPINAFRFLVLGGVLYCIGVVFYLYKNIPYHHGIWHVFVLLGAISHFTAIYLTV